MSTNGEANPAPAPRRPGRGRLRRWARRLILAILLVAAAGLGARALVARYTDLDRRLPDLVREVEAQTGLEIEVEGAKLDLGPRVAILVRGIRARGKGGGEPLVEAASLRMVLRLRALLHKRLLFDRIEIRSPAFRVERDAAGRFDFEEPFARFLSYRPAAPSPSLSPAGVASGERTSGESWRPAVAVDSLRILKGKVFFHDASVSPPLSMELRDLDLATARHAEAGSLEFVFSAVSRQKGGPPARIESSGHFANVYAAPAFAAVGLSAHLAIRGLDPGRYLASLAAPDAVRSCSGRVDIEADYSGSLSGPFTVETEARFASLAIDAPFGWQTPLEVGNGSVRARIERKESAVAFEDLAFEAEGISIRGRLALEDLASGDPMLTLAASTPMMEIPRIEPFFPLSILTGHFWKYITTVVDRGRGGIESFEGRGRLSEFKRIREPANRSILRSRMRFEDAGGVPGAGFGRLDGLTGTLTLEDGIVHFVDFKGAYGASRFDSIEGEVEDVYEATRRMTLRVRGDAGLADLRGAFAVPRMPKGVRRVADSIEVRGGRASLEARVTTDFRGMVDYDGTVEARACDLAVAPWGLEASGLAGKVAVTRSRISTAGLTGRVAGSEIALSGAVSPYIGDATLDLTLASPGIPGGRVYAFLGRPLPKGKDGGVVGGHVSIRGPAARASDLEIRGEMDLREVPLRERPGEDLLEAVTGSARIEADAVAFDLGKATWKGTPFRASGTYRKGAPATLDVAVSSDSFVDLDALLSSPGAASTPAAATVAAPAARAKGAAPRVHAKLALARGRLGAVEFQDLAAGFGYAGESLAIERAEGKACGGSFALRGAARIQGGAPSALELTGNIAGADASALLASFGAKGQDLGGTADLSGLVRMRGATKEERIGSLGGRIRFELRDGAIRRSEVLWKVLDLVNVGSWVKRPLDFRLEGLHYSTIRGTVELSKGVAHTEDLKLEGEPVNVEVLGDYDMPKKEIRCVVAVKPFGLVDAVVDRIPIAEQIKNGLGLTKYNFAVTGSSDEPRILPAALGKMDEFLEGLLKWEAGEPSRPKPAVPASPAPASRRP